MMQSAGIAGKPADRSRADSDLLVHTALDQALLEVPATPRSDFLGESESPQQALQRASISSPTPSNALRDPEVLDAHGGLVLAVLGMEVGRQVVSEVHLDHDS